MPGVDGIEITGPAGDRYDEILTPGALALIARLQRELGPRRAELLAARARRQDDLSAGGTLDFLAETRGIREDLSWRVAPPAPGLVDRRVEITGPTDRKMTINALNSGARVWLADFEDANTPLWHNMITGQLNLKDALDRKIDFTSDEGKSYQLRPDAELATIVVRPRGWHLDEKHLRIDGGRASGSLFDFALYFFHCAQRQLDKGKGPYFYLAKLESHLEARLWNDAFNIAQDTLGVPRGTIRATVLIETIPAAFEMEEILYELREHRVSTCHGRGAHAMGGMAAFIPSRRDAEVNATALAKVRDDKTRESRDGFDGSWVAHPDLVPICREVFDGVLGNQSNQLGKLREDVSVTADDLLSIAKTPGGITEAGLRNNISVGLQYLANWLAGNGAVAIFNLMEDAATAEISRSQVWQWLHNDVSLAEDPVITRDLVERLIGEELAAIREQYGDAFDPAGFEAATALFTEVALADDYVEFLTIPAYERMP